VAAGPPWPFGGARRLWPWAEALPTTVLGFNHFPYFIFLFKISKKVCNVQKYIENGIKLGKTQNKFI
jgi:hypothetical protein